MLPDILNYIPDPKNGRPIADGQVFFFLGGYSAPSNIADVNSAFIAEVTANGNPVPQPIFTSKGGTLMVGSQTNQPQLNVDPLVKRVAVYDKCGRLVYSTAYNGIGAFVDADALAAPDSTVLVGGAVASSFGAVYAKSVSLDTYNVPVAPADCSAQLTAAILDADSKGLELIWPEKSYTHSSPISVSLSNELRWRCNGAALTYTGSDTLTGFDVALVKEKEHEVTGKGLYYNAGGKCHAGVRFFQPVADAIGSITLDNVSVENIEMQVGAGISSSGLQVRGGFGKVVLNKPKAKNIKMRAGAGVAGSNGITGILVLNNFGTTGAYALNTYINSPEVSNVYSLDPAYQFDMDAIGVFANPEVDRSNGASYCVIDKPIIKNSWGRDVKMQVAYSEIKSPESVISEGPIGGIINTAYDFQTGSGLLVGGSYDIRNVTHIAGICRFSGGNNVSPVSSKWSGGMVRILNATVSFLAIHDVDDATTSSCRFESVNVFGTVRNFLLQRTNGYDKDISTLDNVTVRELTESLARVESRGGGIAPYRGVIVAENCTHRGTPVPIVSKAKSPNASRALFSERQCFGFTKSITVSDFADDTSSGLAVAPDVYYKNVGTEFVLGGTEKSYTIVLPNDTEVTLPDHGYSFGYIASIFMCRLRSDRANIAIDDGGIEVINKGSTVEVSDTEPVTGALRIWRTGKLIKMRQVTGQDRPVMVTLVG